MPYAFTGIFLAQAPDKNANVMDLQRGLDTGVEAVKSKVKSKVHFTFTDLLEELLEKEWAP